MTDQLTSKGRISCLVESSAKVRYLILLLPFCSLFLSAIGHTQTSDQSAVYTSPTDDSLTIRRITVLPVVDNTENIYARHIEAQLIELVKASHRWDYVDFKDLKFTDPVPALSALEEQTSEVHKLTDKIDADAFIAAVATRGPTGMSVRVDLFLRSDGKLLAQAILRDYQGFEINDLKSQVRKLYGKMISHIPYDGLILSRQQNRVTINLGTSDHIKKDQVVTAVQIISVQRHPKFNFLISTDKEIIGRIKILKVDETLSFGLIVSEKERGAIRKLAKIAGVDPVNYPSPDEIGDNGKVIGERADSGVFGKDPREWLPVRPPSFGQVGLKVGIGQYSSNVDLQTEGNLQAKTSIYPSIGVSGELWLNPEWMVSAEITQAVVSDQSMSRYSLTAGYNFLLQDDFFGPKFFVNSGFGLYRMTGSGSNAATLTTVTYSGLLLGLGGSLPVTADKIWSVGANFNLYLFPGLSETPVTSGGKPKNSIDEFSLFVQKRIAVNMVVVGSIDYSLYMTEFNGSGTRPDPATSLSQRHTDLTLGLDYQF